MSRKLYFGTRGFMQEVKMPSIDADVSSAGWGSKSQYLNGGAGVRNSVGSHKEYVFSWNTAPIADLRPINDYANGIYDSHQGTNLVYFIDPGAERQNVVSLAFSSPAQALADGLSLFLGQVGSLVTTPANTLMYPARSVQHTLNTSSKSIWLPIPAGYTLWVGAHGTASSANSMIATPSQGLIDLAAEDLTLLPVTSTTRVNASFDSTDCDGVTLTYKNLGPASTETVTISGVIAQILPTGETPALGGFISGQGHSGCQFEGKPNLTEHSAALDKWAMSAKLIETGFWL